MVKSSLSALRLHGQCTQFLAGRGTDDKARDSPDGNVSGAASSHANASWMLGLAQGRVQQAPYASSDVVWYSMQLQT